MSIATSLLEGAIAGAVATWLMGKVTARLDERESAATRARADATLRAMDHAAALSRA